MKAKLDAAWCTTGQAWSIVTARQTGEQRRFGGAEFGPKMP
jgi:hypothetical protein